MVLSSYYIGIACCAVFGGSGLYVFVGWKLHSTWHVASKPSADVGRRRSSKEVSSGNLVSNDEQTMLGNRAQERSSLGVNLKDMRWIEPSVD